MWVYTWECGNLQQNKVVRRCQMISKLWTPPTQVTNVSVVTITCLAMYSSASSTSYFTVLHLAAVTSTREAAWSVFIPCFTKCSCEWWHTKNTHQRLEIAEIIQNKNFSEKANNFQTPPYELIKYIILRFDQQQQTHHTDNTFVGLSSINWPWSSLHT